jgi:hypothetical protein
MHVPPSLILLAQAMSPDDITREFERLQRNFQFLSYGFAAAWVILIVYMLLMVGRERKLRQEIRSLQNMLEYREKQ